MNTTPIFVYKNLVFFDPESEYLYDDAYLVIFQEGIKYFVFRANDAFNFDHVEPEEYDCNELQDLINDTIGGEKIYELIHYNPNLDKNKYRDFVANL
jgi:hypothetical protein